MEMASLRKRSVRDGHIMDISHAGRLPVLNEMPTCTHWLFLNGELINDACFLYTFLYFLSFL